MKHNGVEQVGQQNGDVPTHSEMETIFNDARRYGSLKDSVLAHGIEQIDYLFPDAKNMAILYCSAEPNSKFQATNFEKYLEEDKISYKEFTASDSNDIGSVVQSATEYADVIYIPTDNTMAQNTEAINNIALPAGVPIIAGEEGICNGCGVATLSISYYDIGYRAGETAYDILVNG